MQIIESSLYGVRSAIYHLEPHTKGPTFRLYPMIHLGEPAFYSEISRRLAECDHVLCEGVGGSSVSIFTFPYRMAAKNPRLGLVTQHTMNLDEVRDKMVNADVSGKAFDERLEAVSLWKRILVFFWSPLAGLYSRFFLTRRFIARHMSLTLHKSRREILAEDDDDPWQDIILDWRDEHLIKLLEEHRHKPEHDGRTIGVLYGAAHMRAVLKYLMIRDSYRVVKAEWTLVFRT